MTKSKIGLRMSDALLIVDLQRDFCAGGKLAVPGAEEIVPKINALVEEAQAAGALIVASRDLHPPDHMSFAAFGGPWPQHCVRGTPGAELHPKLRLPAGALFVAKARRAERQQSSAFDATGLAEDVCVKASAMDAARLGFRVHVLHAATRPLTPRGGENACAEMRAAGVTVIEAP